MLVSEFKEVTGGKMCTVMSKLPQSTSTDVLTYTISSPSINSGQIVFHQYSMYSHLKLHTVQSGLLKSSSGCPCFITTQFVPIINLLPSTHSI